MKRWSLTTCFVFSIFFSSLAQLKVSEDKRYLLTKEGKPFFWLGDTGWELFHRLSKQEAVDYLENRARKGFTVIQAVVLAEFDGLNVPNYYGDRPLLNNDPTKPNDAYFKHVDYVVDRANKLGLVIAMLPSWGDKWNKKWGVGPEIFTPENAAAFGEYIGRRYRNKSIIWVMGGDRPIEEDDDRRIITAMAEGIKKGDDGLHLITYHPPGDKSSSDYFPDAAWLDFHMTQSGHSSDTKNYLFNEKHLSLKPLKPHLDGEPRYEDHPNKFNPGKHGWLDEFDVRQTAYWSMFSGAFGHTYGNHNIWQFYTPERKPVSWARTHWRVAIDHPGSMQVGIMKRFLESRPWQRLVPDQSVILSENAQNAEYNVAAVSADGDFMMIYLPYGKKIRVSTERIKGDSLQAWWCNPRDGTTISLGRMENKKVLDAAPHSEGRGSDWVLVIDDAAKNYREPRGRQYLQKKY